MQVTLCGTKQVNEKKVELKKIKKYVGKNYLNLELKIVSDEAENKTAVIKTSYILKAFGTHPIETNNLKRK